MLLRFAGLREEPLSQVTSPENGRYFDVWVNAASIRTVRYKKRKFSPRDTVNCIFLGFQDGYLFLCPEMHPLESIEEIVKLINKAKRGKL
jgi:hypothetical protein